MNKKQHELKINFYSCEARVICEGCELLIVDFNLRGWWMIGWRVSRSRAGVSHQAAN